MGKVPEKGITARNSKNMSEQEAFLKDLGQEKGPDVLTDPINPEKGEEVKPEVKPEGNEDAENLRNRRERRLASKLQAERESSIALAARLEAITEAQRAAREGGEADDFLKGVERIYGTETPEATAATELLKSTLKSVADTATSRALEQFREEQRKASEAVSQEEQNLDSMLEELEDDTGIDLTSEKADSTRKGFLTLLEKMSPKDSDGNIIQFADAHAVWEVYAEKIQKKPDTRLKNLADRSMVQTGASADTKVQDDVATRFLKDNGII